MTTSCNSCETRTSVRKISASPVRTLAPRGMTRVERQHFADEAFPRHAEHERAVLDAQRREIFQQRQIVRDGFSKADSGVEGDTHRVNAAGYGAVKTLSKKFPDFRDH